MGWVNNKGGSAVQKFKKGGKVNKSRSAYDVMIEKMKKGEEVISDDPYIHGEIEDKEFGRRKKAGKAGKTVKRIKK